MRRLARFPLLVVAGGMALLGAAGCNSNGGAVPSQPAYDVDVRPILMAHCARCHGAGGNLNVRKEPTGPDASVLPSIQGSIAVLTASRSYLDQFDDSGDCSPDAGAGSAPCKLGAKTWSSTIPGLVRNPLATAVMPPPPAPALDDWEADTLKNWAVENPVICSHSASPDPSICPNGP